LDELAFQLVVPVVGPNQVSGLAPEQVSAALGVAVTKAATPDALNDPTAMTTAMKILRNPVLNIRRSLSGPLNCLTPAPNIH
jgi:hypothetical protein